MLPKKNRADKKSVDIIFKKGRIISTPTLSFRFLVDEKKGIPRVSCVVPKTISKKAVIRNTERRKAYDVLSKYINKLPKGLIGVLMFKKLIEDKADIEKEIENIIAKIN